MEETEIIGEQNKKIIEATLKLAKFSLRVRNKNKTELILVLFALYEALINDIGLNKKEEIDKLFESMFDEAKQYLEKNGKK